MKHRKKQGRHWPWNACLGIVGMLYLAACGTTPPAVLTKVQVERVTIPATFLTVAPVPPAPTSRMQSAAANYIVQLKMNDDECHLDVGAIAATQ